LQKTLLLATSMVLAAGAGFGPAWAADLANSSVPPAPAAAPPSDAYTLNLVYTGEVWDVATGGLRRGTSYMDTMDAQFQVDMGKAVGWTGGTFVAEGFYANAMSTNNQFVGAIDEFSAIDTAADAQMLRVYQLYYDQNFGATDVRFGIYDLETEFGSTKPMNLFLSKDFTWNTALDEAGLSPGGGSVGPGDYPSTPLALRIRQAVTPNLSVQFAVADGAADNPNNPAQNAVLFSQDYGALFLGEVDYTPDKYTKLMAGAWGLTSKLPNFGQFNPDGSQRMIYGQEGAYIGAATRLYNAGHGRGLDGFFTFGMSTPQSTDVAESFNTGLVYTGLFDARPADKIGVAMNINGASSNFSQFQSIQGAPIGPSETSFEATYRAKINDYLTIQPDIQYILHPGYDSTIKNTVALAIHFELAHVFEW
jgi:porin